MSALSIQVPFPVFQDRDGQPLENGYIWIGEPNLNPQTNPVVAYYDAALTIVAPQPLRTLNGYVSRAGTPAQIYVDGVNFSILVQDSKGSMVYNFPDGSGISPDACGVTYTPPFTGGVPYPVCEKLKQTVSVMDFGAVGDGVADDTAALVAANATGKALFFPQPSVFYKVVGTVTFTVPIIAGAYQIFNPPTITNAVYSPSVVASITNNVIFGGVSRPEVNPRWWGAGGSVDDSVALQAALWCVTQASPGITVRLEDNVTYTVSTSMVVDTDYLRLTGGPGSTIKRKNNVPADTMTVLTTGFLGRYTWGPSYPLTNMRFDNFEINGNKANNVIGADDNFENNLNALYLLNSRIENLTVYGSLRFGIAISNSNDVIAQGNIISACDEGGLYAEVGARIIFDSNRITDTPVAPWNIGSLTFNYISQGVISNNVSVSALDGIYIRNTCDAVSVVGNTISSPTRYGIWLADESAAFTNVPKRITISGNTVSGSGDSCIRMQLSSQVVVTGNFLRAQATDYCIEFNNSEYQTFSGNICIGFATQPIKDVGGNTFTEITNIDGIYTPVVVGSTVNGVGTYTTQVGRWSANGNRVSFTADVATTAHTGSGAALLSLPFYAALVEDTTIPVTIYGTTYTGYAVIEISGAEGIRGVLKTVNPATGALTNLTLPAVGSYVVNGSYQVRDFTY